MPGEVIIDSDLILKGKAKVDTVPNTTGTVVTYDSTSKIIGTRTNAQIISDLGLIDATNIASLYYTKTQLQTSGQAAVHWNNLTNIPATFYPSTHTHTIPDVTGLQTALDGKVDDSQVLTNVPAGAVFTDTTYNVFSGGGPGLVPYGPMFPDPDKYLNGLGEWDYPENTTYTQGTGISIVGGVISITAHNHTIAQVTGLQGQLDLKALDSNVVHKTGNETIAGNKTFNSSPVVPTGTLGTHAVNLSQLENLHQVVNTGGLNNPADSVNYADYANKSYFDYNWGGGGFGIGSVINFSGVTGAYSTEIFGSYNGSQRFAMRTRNGDSNVWNPAVELWHSENLNSTTFAQSLTTGFEGEHGQIIYLSNGGQVNVTNYYITSRDGTRNPNDILPITSGKQVRFDFVTAGSFGGTGNFGGVMTYAPWAGTTASTGDSSYQLFFGNKTGIDGAGKPMLRLRKGIDASWGGLYEVPLIDVATSNLTLVNLNGTAVDEYIKNNVPFNSFVSPIDNLCIGGGNYASEGGFSNVTTDDLVAGLSGDNLYYHYGSADGGYASSGYGILINKNTKNVGIGTTPDTTYKLKVEGKGYFKQFIKAEGNIKSLDENPNSLFIPDGTTSTIEHEIQNEGFFNTKIRLTPLILRPANKAVIDIDYRLIRLYCAEEGYIEIVPNVLQDYKIYNISVGAVEIRKGSTTIGILASGYCTEITVDDSAVMYIEDQVRFDTY